MKTREQESLAQLFQQSTSGEWGGPWKERPEAMCERSQPGNFDAHSRIITIRSYAGFDPKYVSMRVTVSHDFGLSIIGGRYHWQNERERTVNGNGGCACGQPLFLYVNRL